MAIISTGLRRLSQQEFDIFQLSDFPDPISSEIILAEGVYNFKSLIDIGSNVFIIPEGKVVSFRGLDAFLTGVTTASASTLFQTKGKAIFEFALVEMFIECPNGTVFDISSPAFNLDGGVFIFESAFGNCDSMGTINNMGTVDFSRSAIRAVNTGLSISNLGSALMADSQYLDWNDSGATMFSFSGTCRNIYFDGNHFSPQASEAIFDFDAGGTYRNVLIDSNIHDDTPGGSVFASGSLDQNNSSILFGDNRNMPRTADTDKQFVFDQTPQTTMSSTFVDITNATLTAKDLRGDGNYTISFSFIISGSVANTTASFRLLVNGSPISGASPIPIFLKTNGADLTPTLFGNTTGIVAGDVLTVQWSTDKGTLTLTQFDFLISGILGERVVP